MQIILLLQPTNTSLCLGRKASHQHSTTWRDYETASQTLGMACCRLTVNFPNSYSKSIRCSIGRRAAYIKAAAARRRSRRLTAPAQVPSLFWFVAPSDAAALAVCYAGAAVSALVCAGLPPRPARPKSPRPDSRRQRPGPARRGPLPGAAGHGRCGVPLWPSCCGPQPPHRPPPPRRPMPPAQPGAARPRSGPGVAGHGRRGAPPREGPGAAHQLGLTLIGLGFTLIRVNPD